MQDVLFGKGTIINTHPGNQQFRSLVNSQKQLFGNAKSNKEKRSIVTSIFVTIGHLHPPGRFLVEDRRSSSSARSNPINIDGSDQSGVPSLSNIHPTLLTKTWSLVENEKALDKIMHRLRERGGKGELAATEGSAMTRDRQCVDDKRNNIFDVDGGNSEAAAAQASTGNDDEVPVVTTVIGRQFMAGKLDGDEDHHYLDTNTLDVYDSADASGGCFKVEGAPPQASTMNVGADLLH